MKLNLIVLSLLVGGLFAVGSAQAASEGENADVQCTGACNTPISYMKNKDGGVSQKNSTDQDATSADTVGEDG